MKTITRFLAHDLAKLHDELLAGVPALQSTPTGPGGRLVAAMSIANQGNQLTLQVPDEVDEATVDALLAAHDPTPRPQEPDRRAERIANLKGAGTQAQKIVALEALVLSLAGEDA